MGSKNKTSSGSSNSGGGSSNNNNNNNVVIAPKKQTKKATNTVKKKVKFQTDAKGNTYTMKDGERNYMYGGQVSKATNEYLVSIGEAKKTGGGGYMLTSKGWAMKYGSYTKGQAQEGTAMGTGNSASIIGSVPISEQMFERQKKIKAVALGGMSLMVGPIMGSPLRMMAGKELTKQYSDYQKSFKANLNTTFDVSSLANEGVANSAMGEVDVVSNNTNKKKSKTSKNTTKYFAGTGMDESTNKRTFYT